MRKKYLTTRRHRSLIIKKVTSHNWKALKSTYDFLKFGLKWVVEHGNKINFLNDRWLDLQTLREQVESHLKQEEYDLKIKDIVN